MSKWTEKEVQFLKENYPKYGNKWCAAKLGRSRDSLQGKVKELNLDYCGSKPKYQKENLEPIVKNSNNLCEVLNKLGLKCGGDNYKFIRGHIERCDIDISHFNNDYTLEGDWKFNKKKKPLEEVMVSGSTYHRKDLRRRLIKENILDYKCSVCGNNGKWNGEELALHLDHINGVNDDHRYENLRFLCPNCHSQTKTYAGKVNKVDKRFIKKEGLTEKQREQHEKRRKVERPSYQQLMEEIEKFGYLETGRRYGVSDNAIRKWVRWYKNHEVVDN